jgi:hypothetical protein
MAVTSGWDLGSEADREAGWGRTVPLGVAGVTRRGPLDERAACCLPERLLELGCGMSEKLNAGEQKREQFIDGRIHHRLLEPSPAIHWQVQAVKLLPGMRPALQVSRAKQEMGRRRFLDPVAGPLPG